MQTISSVREFDSFLEKRAEGGGWMDTVFGKMKNPQEVRTQPTEGAYSKVRPDIWAGMTKQMERDPMFRASQGENRKYITSAGTGLAGGALGGLVGGAKGALIGTALGALLGYVMEAFEFGGIEEAWQWLAQKRAEGGLEQAKAEADAALVKLGKNPKEVEAKFQAQRLKNDTNHQQTVAKGAMGETGAALTAANTAKPTAPVRPYFANEKEERKYDDRQATNQDAQKKVLQSNQEYRQRAHNRATSKFLDNRMLNVTTPGSEQLGSPTILKPDAQEKWTTMDDKTGSLLPWQSVLQKAAYDPGEPTGSNRTVRPTPTTALQNNKNLRTKGFLKRRMKDTVVDPSISEPIELKPDGREKFKLQKEESMLPWQQVLQKAAEIGPAAAPTQAMPQQPAAPQDMGPSKSDIWSHQTKMKEMEGQKALIDAKTQAETNKAQSAASLASTKNSQAMGGGQNPQQTGVNGGAQAGDMGQSMAQPTPPSENGIQVAAQMPTAQWGQPQGQPQA